MTEGNIQYNKINNIYLSELQRFCNPLKYIVNLGLASVDNDFSGLQYTLSASQRHDSRTEKKRNMHWVMYINKILVGWFMVS